MFGLYIKSSAINRENPVNCMQCNSSNLRLVLLFNMVRSKHILAWSWGDTITDFPAQIVTCSLKHFEQCRKYEAGAKTGLIFNLDPPTGLDSALFSSCATPQISMGFHKVQNNTEFGLVECLLFLRPLDIVWLGCCVPLLTHSLLIEAAAECFFLYSFFLYFLYSRPHHRF